MVSRKFLGIIALLGAPWLGIGFALEQHYPHLEDSWFTGLWGLFYITGWMCSIVHLQQLQAAGNDRFGRSIFWILLFTLLVANVSNIIQLVVEKDKPYYFRVLDMCWPLSNVLMLAAGIKMIRTRRLQGWKRYIPLMTGLWLPLALFSLLVDGYFSQVFNILYSAVAWSLLSVVVLTTKPVWRCALTRQSNYNAG